MAKGKSLPTVNPNRRFWLGIMIILPAFVLIGGMFYMQHITSVQAIDTLNNLIKENATSETITATVNTYDGINSSNQSFFNIILAVFAAWVGSVVAFYFGSENLQQAQQTLKEALSTKQELKSKTIQEVLKNNTETKNIITVAMDSSVQDVRKELQNITNVLVTDNKNKPMGILYRWDLQKQAQVDIYGPSDPKDTDKLSDIIENIKSEYIRGHSWSKTNGVKNYATLELNDNLFQAKEKMQDIAESTNSLLSVRAVVVNKEGQAEAIVNFANLTEGII